MESKKPFKLPVGAQREWSSGRVVKTHDNTPFDDVSPPWMPIPFIPSNIKDAAYDCQRVGDRINAYEKPIKGKLWLDKEFEEFTTSTGKVFRAAQFKKFSFAGTTYDFRMELEGLYMYNAISLNARIAEVLVEENELKIDNLLREGEKVDPKSIALTKDEIKEIKARVRREWKDEEPKITPQEIKEIQDKLHKILSYLEQGVDFPPGSEEEKTYKRARIIIDGLISGEFYGAKNAKDECTSILKQISSVFKDNFGVRVSLNEDLENAFNKYLYRFKKEIEDEELARFQEEIGVDLYAPTDVFYKALESHPMFQEEELDSDKIRGTYVSKKTLLGIGGSFDEVIIQRIKKIDGGEEDIYRGEPKYLVSYLDGTETHQDVVYESKLKRAINASNGTVSSLTIPLKLRMMSLYGKEIEGNITKEDITLFHTTEAIANYLPPGHFTTNNLLRKITKGNVYEGDNGYAYYSGKERSITLSSNAASQTVIGIVDIHNGQEVASTMIHEIGHSVSTKLGRRRSRDYKQFVVDCGWSWQQFQWTDEKRNIDKHNNFIATGDDLDIKRQGSKASVPLITAYAGKSPEEAFAEYYSFYSQYKKEIDHYLVHKDEKIFHKEAKVNLVETKTHFRDFLPENKFKNHSSTSEGMETSNRRSEMDSILQEQHRDLEDHIRVNVVDPYINNLKTVKEIKVNPSAIIREKRDSTSTNKKYPNPVFTILEKDGSHDIISPEDHDAGTHFANKYLRRFSPCYSITRECYNLLQKKGYNDNQIKDYTLSKVADKNIPKVADNKKGENIISFGLRYRNDVITSEKLSKMETIFRSMKNIWESEALQKALQEVFGENDTLEKADYTEKLKRLKERRDPDGIENDTTFDYREFIAPYLNIIQQTLVNKKYQQYADVLVKNQKNQILLVRRSSQDDFMPNKWWIPGGKIEDGEEPIQAAARELQEETGIDIDFSVLQFLEKKQVSNGGSSHRFSLLIPEYTPTILDNEELHSVEWVDCDKILEYDLLGEGEDLTNLYNLCPSCQLEEDLLTSESLFRRKEDLNTLFNTEKISTEEYLKKQQSIRDDVQKSFDLGKISTEEYKLIRF